MAKKKTDDNLSGVDSTIAKKFGSNIFISAESIIDRKRAIIPVSPAINLILGGGIESGSFCIVTGAPKIGKTATVLKFCSNAQRIPSEFGNRMVYYLNIEGRIKSRDLRANNLLLDDEHFKLISSAPGSILNGEAFIEIAENIIKEQPGAIVILDSISAICTEEEMVSDLNTRFRANAPLLLARFCRRISQILPVNDSIVIAITHQMANMGMGYKQKLESSGTKIQYQNDVKLEAQYSKPLTQGENQIGQEIHWVAANTSLIGPGRKCTSFLRFNHGIDEELELAELACDLGLVKKASAKGGWLSINYNDEEKKVQGKEGLREFIINNEGFKRSIFDKLEVLYS